MERAQGGASFRIDDTLMRMKNQSKGDLEMTKLNDSD